MLRAAIYDSACTILGKILVERNIVAHNGFLIAKEGAAITAVKSSEMTFSVTATDLGDFSCKSKMT